MRRLNKTLTQFSAFLPFLDGLKERSEGAAWLEPIAEGKWSIREILTHLMHWDRNSLEVMVPNMVAGARLAFVDIEAHNREAAAIAANYTDLEILIGDVGNARRNLLKLLQERYNDSIKLTIDSSNYTYKKFVNVFIHHDEHHIRQIDAFLERRLQG